MIDSRKVFASLMTCSLLAPVAVDAAQTQCHPPPKKKCTVKVEVAGVASNLEVTLESSLPDSGLADVTGQSISWQSFAQEGSHPAAGTVRVVLDPDRQSVGHLDLPTLPSMSTMSFFWRIETDLLGTFVSVEPAMMAGMIDSLPPGPDVVYTLQRPVAFHRLGDPLQQAVLMLNEGKYGGGGGSSKVPALSPWGIGILLLTMLAGSWILVMRKRSLSASA